MKANAPEKIYIHPDIGGREFLRLWLHRPANNESVEYVRADACIEKACEWLKENGGIYWMDDYDLPTDDLVNDFKKYMEGE